MSLAERLRRALVVLKGREVEELARKAGCHADSIYRFRRGDCGMSIDLGERLMGALGLTVDAPALGIVEVREALAVYGPARLAHDLNLPVARVAAFASGRLADPPASLYAPIAAHLATMSIHFWTDPKTGDRFQIQVFEPSPARPLDLPQALAALRRGVDALFSAGRDNPGLRAGLTGVKIILADLQEAAERKEE